MGLNGKKKLIFGSIGGVGGGISIAYIINLLLSFNSGMVANATTVASHTKKIDFQQIQIENLEEGINKVAIIKYDIEHMRGQIDDLDTKQVISDLKQDEMMLEQRTQKLVLDEIRRAVVPQ